MLSAIKVKQLVPCLRQSARPHQIPLLRSAMAKEKGNPREIWITMKVVDQKRIIDRLVPEMMNSLLEEMPRRLRHGSAARVSVEACSFRTLLRVSIATTMIGAISVWLQKLRFDRADIYFLSSCCGKLALQESTKASCSKSFIKKTDCRWGYIYLSNCETSRSNFIQ